MLQMAAASDIGRVRAQNQDVFSTMRLHLWQDAWLLAVADGMGGHQGGQIASRLAISTLESVLDGPGDLPDGSGLSHSEPTLQLLQQAFWSANRRLLHTASQNSQLNGMGTTLTAVVWWENRWLVSHVGDSRAYRVNHNTFELLTQDHSLVAELVRKGDLNWDDARSHPQRHLLLKALGTPKLPEVDLSYTTAEEGDLLLLVTDGLTSLLNEDEIHAITQAVPFDEIPQKLIDRANQQGGFDNITVVAASRGQGKGGRS